MADRYAPWNGFHETRTLFEDNFQIHFRQPLETVEKSLNRDGNCWDWWLQKWLNLHLTRNVRSPAT